MTTYSTTNSNCIADSATTLISTDQRKMDIVSRLVAEGHIDFSEAIELVTTTYYHHEKVMQSPLSPYYIENIGTPYHQIIHAPGSTCIASNFTNPNCITYNQNAPYTFTSNK